MTVLEDTAQKAILLCSVDTDHTGDEVVTSFIGEFFLDYKISKIEKQALGGSYKNKRLALYLEKI